MTLVSEGVDPSGIDGTSVTAADDIGLGNATLGARVRLAGERSDPYAIAVAMAFAFPTAGGDQHYRGEQSVSFAPRLIGELRPGHGARIVLDVGARIHEEATSASINLAVQHELTWALGFAIPVLTDGDPRTHLDAHAQLFGATTFARAFERDSTALEALVGLKLHHATGVVAGIAGGAGLTRGIGTPDARAVVTIGYALPEALPAPDRDEDGVPDAGDRCPDEPEDRDGHQDDDGCPDPDDDADGIADAADGCPREPETANGIDDEDGCPDADTDGDGIPDSTDACVDRPEDRDEHEDADGCPDLDEDGDGVADAADRCPTEPGPVESDGCPEEPRIAIAEERIEIRDVVYFQRDRADVQRHSHAVLLEVARVLNAHPEITRVVVEGHADSRGERERNAELSAQRAQAVVTFLVERGGVASERLEAQGFGSDRPIVEDATTSRQHAQNRRVEFRVIAR